MSERTLQEAPDRPPRPTAPLPADPRESRRGRVRSLIMALVAVALVAAFTWGVLSWREAQIQEEEAQQAAVELREEDLGAEPNGATHEEDLGAEPNRATAAPSQATDSQPQQETTA